MKHLVFHTQIPFGYLLFALSLLVLALVAAALIHVGLRKRQRRLGLVASGCALLAFIAVTVAANLNEEPIDLNPLIRETSELTGAWKGDGSNLELLPDGSYQCVGPACARLGASGLWQRSGDFFISFDPANAGKIAWRVTALAGRLRLAARDASIGSEDAGQAEFTLEHGESQPAASIEKTGPAKPAGATPLAKP